MHRFIRLTDSVQALVLLSAFALVIATGCAHEAPAANVEAAAETAAAEAEANAEEAIAAARAKVTMGNGEKNWIVVEGVGRAGRTLSFPEVHLDHAGWLVLHPFEDGKPQGKIYVAARYLPAGTHQAVTIEIQTAPEPASGTPFVAMLHDDVDEDQTFDFVFVDALNVADKAVFEGNTMVAHVIQVP